MKTRFYIALPFFLIFFFMYTSVFAANWALVHSSETKDVFVDTSSIVCKHGYIYFWHKHQNSESMMNRFPDMKTAERQIYAFVFETEAVWHPLRTRDLSSEIRNYAGYAWKKEHTPTYWRPVNPDDDRIIIIDWVRKYCGQ